ncbi:MAG: S1C family serine protease [Sciscionella sp.]
MSEFDPRWSAGRQGGPGHQQRAGFDDTARFSSSGWVPPGGQWAYPVAQPYRRSRWPRIVVLLGALGLAMVLGVGLGRIVFWTVGASGDVSVQGVNPDVGSFGASGGTSSTSIDPAAIAAKVDPGLVDINTVLGYQSAEAAGTGIVLSPDGEILTNNHVVEGATSIRVTDVGNGQTYSASVVGYDRGKDMAVLMLRGASGLRTAPLGNSSTVSVGDAIVGLGNAGGVGGTPSAAAGTVTALGQSITASDESSGASEKLTGLIQVNADIQSGDSGGALANNSGRVIGMDTAASSSYQFGGDRSQSGTGQSGSDHRGYAIPINQALALAHQITSGQSSATVHIGGTAFIGVSVSDAAQDQDGAGALDPYGQGGAGTASGAQIQDVFDTGPAAQAGLTPGDVITALDGQTVDSATTLTNLMDTHHPGDTLSITWVDTTGQQHTATLSPISGPVG